MAGWFASSGAVDAARIVGQHAFGTFPAMAAYALGKDAQVSTMTAAAAKHAHEAIVASLGNTANMGVLTHKAINDDGFGEIGTDLTEFTNACPGDLFGVMVRTADAQTP